MLALMICYTVFSLWILSQPLVEQRRNEAKPTEDVAEDVAQPALTEETPGEWSGRIPKAPMPQPSMPGPP